MNEATVSTTIDARRRPSDFITHGTKPVDTVIRVGDGRGFIVKDAGRARLGWRYERIVITAAHCLPFLPPCHAFSYLEDRTYKALLGLLGQEPTVWAECLFADPVADIAVLGEPDSQELSEQWDAFEALVMAVTPLRIADAPKEARRAQLLSLAGEWFDCKVQHVGGPLLITDANKGIVGGMSGSPILDAGGSAIGVLRAPRKIPSRQVPTNLTR
jgi:hypothetical protein